MRSNTSMITVQKLIGLTNARKDHTLMQVLNLTRTFDEIVKGKQGIAKKRSRIIHPTEATDTENHVTVIENLADNYSPQAVGIMLAAMIALNPKAPCTNNSSTTSSDQRYQPVFLSATTQDPPALSLTEKAKIRPELFSVENVEAVLSWLTQFMTNFCDSAIFHSLNFCYLCLENSIIMRTHYRLPTARIDFGRYEKILLSSCETIWTSLLNECKFVSRYVITNICFIHFDIIN